MRLTLGHGAAPGNPRAVAAERMIEMRVAGSAQLGDAGLGPPGAIAAYGIPARQATLQSIAASTGAPAVRYTETAFDFLDDSDNTDGASERTAAFGRVLGDLLMVEGNHSFHARATYGNGCTGMREFAWSLHVGVGVDPGRSTVMTTPLPQRPDGAPCVGMRFTPRDRCGNLLRPGRSDSFTLEPRPGNAPSGPVLDLGDGSYEVEVCSDPDSLEPPRIETAQPGRPPVALTAPDFRLFIHSVPFICGEQKDDRCVRGPARPGRYATEINIHNAGAKDAPVRKRMIPLAVVGTAAGHEPWAKNAATSDAMRLPAHSATMDDCCRILEALLGAAPSGRVPADGWLSSG